MSIHEAEEKLFTDWRKERADFVADGVVDEKSFTSGSPKLLFVLKEVNAPDRGGWDLREFVKNGGCPETWNNVTRWVEGIRRLPENIPWKELADIDEKRRRDALKSIAIVNLKKSPGESTADPKSVAKAAEEDSKYLKKQFKLYDPDITICCGTVKDFQKIDPYGFASEWRSTSRGIWYNEYSHGKFVIEFLHPEARCSPNLLYYGLIDALGEVLHSDLSQTSS